MKTFYTYWLYAVTLAALVGAGLQSMSEEDRVIADISSRSAALATSIEESVVANFHAKRPERIAKLVEKLRSQSRVVGVALCAAPGKSLNSVAFPRSQGWELLCQNANAIRAREKGSDVIWSANYSKARFQYLAHPLEVVEAGAGVDAAASGGLNTLILVQDLGWLRSFWLENFGRAFLGAWLIGVAFLFLVTSQIRFWFSGQLKFLRRSLRSVVKGRGAQYDSGHDQDPNFVPELKPITREIDRLAAKIFNLSQKRNGSETKSVDREDIWLTDLKKMMENRTLTVIANREPYIHQKLKDRIEVVRPASGLVTALEPVLRKSGGLWIAHGSGSADRETVDENDEVAVPPGQPTYKIRRVWLSEKEEAGYYYGFSNEGLWPLCHLAHTRPIFRLSDWEQYHEVNQRFCEAIPEQALGEDSLILVQDYHFAMLPRMIRERSERTMGKKAAKVGIFWHIPWPNPEAFGICPWNRDLLKGMLGADVIGFHTQYHCNNFLEACNRYLEARIDYERFSVTMENHETFVRPFPIGIATQPVRALSDEDVQALKAKYGIKAQYVAVGVDRLDYTKGLLERVESVGRFLEKHPEFVGKFSLVQMGSPSRGTIPAYRLLSEQLSELVDKINLKFANPADPEYKPIVFLPSHHEWDEIQYFYQMGDVCMVTSLHDGMNLVAKEYVWCQRADRGALILSKFTGASRELTEALIVNPYSIEEMADAIHAALSQSSVEKQLRMNAMKSKIQAHNAYHWASDLIQALVTENGSSVVTPGPGLRTGTGLRSGILRAVGDRNLQETHAGSRGRTGRSK